MNPYHPKYLKLYYHHINLLKNSISNFQISKFNASQVPLVDF